MALKQGMILPGLWGRSWLRYVRARALQLAPDEAMIAFTAVAANLAAIMAPSRVRRPNRGRGASDRRPVIDFCLVIAGAALMPAEARAARF
jgi:hypothetical protein